MSSIKSLFKMWRNRTDAPSFGLAAAGSVGIREPQAGDALCVLCVVFNMIASCEHGSFADACRLA